VEWSLKPAQEDFTLNMLRIGDGLLHELLAELEE
jgi:hypothetical protein